MSVEVLTEPCLQRLRVAANMESMWSRSFAIAVLAALIVSVPRTASGEGSRAEALTFNGLQRTYYLYRPASLSRERPAPLVVVLHGGGGSGRQAEGAYHWDAVADAHGFVVVYPDGVRRAWNAGSCCGFPLRAGIDDVEFIDALVERIVHDENIDGGRIYVTGMSNGAFLTYDLACHATFPIAAIGPVAGTLVTRCPSPQGTSVLAIHGLHDELVPFYGGHPQKGPNLLEYRWAVPRAVEIWRTADQCPPATSTIRGSVTTEVADCPAGRSVELITIADAGHQWPGSTAKPAERLLEPFGLAPPSRALDATAVLWDFFAAHRSAGARFRISNGFPAVGDRKTT